MILNAKRALQTDREYLPLQRSKVAAAIAMVLANLTSVAPVFAQDASKGSAENGASPSTATSKGGNTLEEILVTAQRRTQSVTDVPYNITAVSGDSLSASGATSATDLSKVVAGLGSFSSGAADGLGENNFTLRGLRTDNVGQNIGARTTVNSVATYYGDTPVFAQILLKDLQRVEVLRGPQGTLYGSGAQGGAIRFIPNRPSFDGFSGELNASGGLTANASDPNASVDGVVNLPLGENLALRLSGAYVRQAGFIDQVNLFALDSNGVPVRSIAGNILSGPVIAPIQKNTNSTDQWMARAAVRYQPTDWLDLEVSYLHQYTHGDDVSSSNPTYLGGPQDLSDGVRPNSTYQTRPGGKYENTQPILQPTTAKLDLVSGTAAFDMGFATLTSVTSYSQNKINSTFEGSVNYVSPFFNLNFLYNYFPRFHLVDPTAIKDTGFTQEVRLVSNGDSRFSYVLGAYYQKQTKDVNFTLNIPGLQAFTNVACPGPGALSFPCFAAGANPQLGDLTYRAQDNFSDSELAAFGELTFKITDAWQVTGGARVFKSTGSARHFQAYPFLGAGNGDGVTQPIAQGASSASSSGSTTSKVFKVNTSYEFSPDNRLFATFSQGFRRGGSNPFATSGPFASLPQYLTYKPDFADNFELGIKGRTLGRRLTYSLSGFWINVKDFQYTGTTPSFYQGTFNGDKLKSRGFELEASFRATPELTLSGSYAYTKANAVGASVVSDLANRSLLDGFQPTDIVVNASASVAAGAILPGVSKHSAVAAIDYEVGLSGDSKLILHGNMNYRSEQNNQIAVAGNTGFLELPAVFMADARVTYDSGKGWSGSLFVTNLTNAVGYSGTQGVHNPIPGVDPQTALYRSRIVAQPRTFGLSLHYGF
jgi:outer membrane receptor protein involved in Fe transport